IPKQGSPLQVWDLSTGKALDGLAQIQDEKCSCFGISPDGLVALIDFGNTLFRDRLPPNRFIRIDSGRELAILEDAMSLGTPTVFAHDGSAFLGYSDGKLKEWDTATGKVRTTLPLEFQPGQQPSALACSPDGKSVALGFNNGTVELWERG